jgi:hypothetical protein
VLSRLEPKKSTNDGTVGRRPNPASLARQIRDRLRTAGYLALREVACEVREGVAFLDGRLLSQCLKQVAQAVAVDDQIKAVPITVVAGTGHPLADRSGGMLTAEPRSNPTRFNQEGKSHADPEQEVERVDPHR